MSTKLVVPGRVVLVGAGPGAADLITVRGLRYLRAADVVLHDRLVPSALLREVRRDALLVAVGKNPHGQSTPQDEINALLVAHAQRGALVVRLKGGDPFVFGRGGEEVLACRAAGVPCEVVPGLSSVIAAGAASLVPLTHRGVAASIGVVAGQRCGEALRRDLRPVAAADTLVVMMGLQQLEAIVAELLAAGRAPDTPALVVERATWSSQRLVRARLDAIAECARRASLTPPATLLVGQAVAVLAETAPQDEPRPCELVIA